MRWSGVLLLMAACGGAPERATSPERSAGAATAAAMVAPADAPTSGVQILSIALRPVASEGKVTAIAVSLRLGGVAATGPFELQMPAMVDGEAGWPDRVRGLVARDSVGELALTRSNGKDADGDEVALWRGDRAPQGPVEVRYEAGAEPGVDGWNVSGTRSQDGGVQSTGETLILLPPGEAPWKLAIAWDLSALGAGASAVTSFGGGAVEIDARRGEIAKCVFMAGRLGRFTLDRGDTHFRGAWLGETAFDVGEAMAWAARARAGQRAFFRDDDPREFTFFIRSAPALGNSWVGTGQTRSFLLAPGNQLAWGRVARFVVAHELVHHWIGVPGSGVRLGGPEGSAYWFTEGFTVHMTRALLLRDGLATSSEFADDLRERTLRYFASTASAASNAEIVEKFWTSLDHQNLPYDRGMLYAAELDAALRARSGGAKTLGAFINAMLDHARADARAQDATAARPLTRELPPGHFRDAVEAELGEAGAARFDAVIVRGERPSPPSDAFGPCFRRVQHRLHRYDLGFAVSSFARKTITGLRPGSAAERAGLTEGLKYLRGKGEIGKVDVPFEITFLRDGKEVTVKWSPKGEAVDGFVWERIPGVAEASCARTP